MEPENSNQKLTTKHPAPKARKRDVAKITTKTNIDLKCSSELNNCRGRNRDRDVGHEIDGGDDDGNLNQVDAFWGQSRKSREGQSWSSVKRLIRQSQPTPLLVNVGMTRMNERE
jgi:hypothetical protein